MDNNVLSSHLNAIAELVEEDDKIVTYKSLTKKLGVHVNTAKQLLHTYLVEQKSRKKSSICATYLLVGKLKDSSIIITLVNEEDKEKEAAKFVEITSDHVYSVHRGKRLSDVTSLCGLTDENHKTSRQYVIQCSKSILRPKKKEEDANIPSIIEKPTKNIFGSKIKIEGQPQHNTDSINKKADDAKSPKKQSLIENKAKVDKGKANKSTKNIATLFSNASQKAAPKPKNTNNDENVVSPPIQLKQEVNEHKNFYENFKEDNMSNVNKNGHKKKREGVKRKRIQLFSDSEDSNDENCSIDEPVSDDEEKSEKSIKRMENIEKDEEKEEVSQQPHNKRKKRKLIDVTVMNEDGYLVTRKEVTFTSDSEDETPQNSASQKNNSPSDGGKFVKTCTKKDGNLSTGSKKQASLLTFFKKN